MPLAARSATPTTLAAVTDDPRQDHAALGRRLLFVVGARRSGTHLLHRLLAVHPGIVDVPSETHLFSHGVSGLVDRFQSSSPGSPTVGKAYLPRADLLDLVRALTTRTLGGYLGDDRSSLLLERSPEHVHHIGLIRELYPDARFVNIARDGFETVRSLAAQSFGPGDLEAAAAEWRDAVLDGHAPELQGEHLQQVRYEAVLADPTRELARLFTGLGLAADDAVLADVAAEAARRQNTWGATKAPLRRRDRATIRRVAGPALAVLDGDPAHPDVRATSTSRAPAAARLETLALAQHAVDRFREVVHDARPQHELDGMFVPDTTFRLVTEHDDRTHRGPSAAREYLVAVREQPSTSWSVVHADSHPAPGLITIVERRRADACEVLRVDVVRHSPAGLGDVVTYLHPLRTPTSPAPG